MDVDAEVEDLRSEVLRKIGRNVVLFQQLEGILKFLVATGKVAGPASQLRESHQQRMVDVHRESLGQIAGRLHDELYAEPVEDPAETERATEPWLSFSFRVHADAAFVDSNRSALTSVINDRNELIHHLLPKWNMKSIDSCKATSDRLDQQRKTVLLEIEKYKRFVDALNETGRELQQFIDSDAGQRYFDLMFLQQSRIALLLGDIASQMARADGWTRLAVAGALLKQHAAEEFVRMRERYGQGSLLKLILATELFDVQSEPTQSGGARMLYRLRENWVMQPGAVK